MSTRSYSPADDDNARFTDVRSGLPRLRRTADGTKQGRREAGEARLWHIGTALAVGFAAAVLGLAAP